jgi:IS30 family transposase
MLGMSPVRIVRTLARMPDPVRLSYETIYTALYTMPRGHLRSSLLSLMRRQHRAKKARTGAASRLSPT